MIPETDKFQEINYVADAPIEENPRSLSAISSNLGSITEGSIVNKKVAVIADAINASGQFINDVINARLDTSAKTILSDFTFGASGAIKMITDENNGLWLSPTGILAKKASAVTLTIGIDGSAVFAGTLAAAAGTLGTITAGTLTGLTINTGTSGKRIVIGALDVGAQWYNTDGTSIALIQPTDSSTLFSATSPNTANRMFQHISFIQAGYNANPMVYLEAANVSTGTTLLSLVQKGALSAQTIDLATTATGNGIVVTHLGDGICGDFYVNNVSGNNYAVRVRSTASAIDALYAEHSTAAMAPAHFRQSSAVVANTHNYYRVLKLDGGGITKSIWISDGNSPNTDALTGAIGDICLNCDGGKAYYNNNGSTGWTAM